MNPNMGRFECNLCEGKNCLVEVEDYHEDVILPIHCLYTDEKMCSWSKVNLSLEQSQRRSAEIERLKKEKEDK